jgi:exodeoxyribonuclease VIII
MSASGMRHLARSPWHFRNRVEIESTKAMLNGSLAHCAQLEPGALSARYVVVPDEAPKRPTKAQWGAAKPSPASVAQMEWWTGFLKTCGERIVVDAGDYAVTQQQLVALQLDPDIAKLFAKGSGEVSVFWIDHEALAAAYDMRGAFNRVAVKLEVKARAWPCLRSSRVEAV